MLPFLIGAGLPTLGGIKDAVVSEGGNAITIALVIFGIVFLFKQQISRMIGFFAIAAIVFFAIGNPESFKKAGEALGKLIFPS